MEKFYYASILSNKIAYLPFWKENKRKDSYFLKENNSWSYVDSKENKFELTKLTKLSTFEKFLYFGNDLLVILLMLLLIFLSFSKSTLAISGNLIFFIGVIIIAYILIFSMKKPKLANFLMLMACIITAAVIFKKYGTLMLYNNFFILCAIYIIFAFSLTSLITKNIVVKDMEQNISEESRANFFKINSTDGILLITYRSEKLSEEEVKKILEKRTKKEQKEKKIKSNEKAKNKEYEDEYYDDEE